MPLILIILLVLILVGVPSWGPAAGGWHRMGWYPSGGIGLGLVILLILVLLGRV